MGNRTTPSTAFQKGQRWISEGEPELGLGRVERMGPRTVTLSFGSTQETREYGRDAAPLRRAAFHPGDSVRATDGTAFTVSSVSEVNGLFTYHGEGQALGEAELSASLSFSKPLERLRAGQVDPPAGFALRVAALEHQVRRRKSAVRGFMGGRIELLPHQLTLAAEVAGRLAPRVLLADEVGLGKTIEACLILHRLHLTGRAQRVLVLVPEPLVAQWFLELFRRFNLWFHIFDEDRCRALETAHPGCNPFLDDQLVLCGPDLFRDSEPRLEQALAAGWDLLVVDEAHHLGWTPEGPSPAYARVERLGTAIPALLLLTATPEHSGTASLFGCLRLLDPNRFYDLGEFLQQTRGYREVAGLAAKLQGEAAFTDAELATLLPLLANPAVASTAALAQVLRADPAVRAALVATLLDHHGTSRVMFRNTRAGVAGFPSRVARLASLAADPDRRRALALEWAADLEPDAPGFHPDLAQDPRIPWLADLLRTSAPEKILLICRSRRKAEAIEMALKHHLKVPMAVFHEGLTLVQRDRGAAWFGESRGARILLCSEIGSEGRNFQFAHHLVLFDLPLDPDLLEQRIGRLDRIGQKAEIQIHVPFTQGSGQELLARWYHEGLNAFETTLPGGRELLERFEAGLRDLAPRASQAPGEVQALLAATREARREVATRLEQGRDRLLELNAFRPEAARALIRELGAEDADPSLERFLLTAFEHFFIPAEEVAPRTYHLGAVGVLAAAFPGLPSEGLTVTRDRQRALVREDLPFLTWDHPLVSGALDLILGSGLGNSSFGHWPAAEPGLFLELVFVLECLAPPHLHVDRFLPPTPLRVLLDARGADLSQALPRSVLARQLRPAAGGALLARPELREQLLPKLLAQGEAIATRQGTARIDQARTALAAHLDPELARLQALKQANGAVRDEEIRLLAEHRDALHHRLGEARLRLEAVCLIQRGPG